MSWFRGLFACFYGKPHPVSDIDAPQPRESTAPECQRSADENCQTDCHSDHAHASETIPDAHGYPICDSTPSDEVEVTSFRESISTSQYRTSSTRVPACIPPFVCENNVKSKQSGTQENKPSVTKDQKEDCNVRPLPSKRQSDRDKKSSSSDVSGHASNQHSPKYVKCVERTVQPQERLTELPKIDPERYVACMVLSGVGDAIGYHNGRWEFCQSSSKILKELRRIGGLSNIAVDVNDWRVSDDTVMHLATAEALVHHYNTSSNGLDDLYKQMALKYVECMGDMYERAPGNRCLESTDILRRTAPDTMSIPFCERHTGCGGAMRSMCIGLLYPRKENLDTLIAVSIEAGRLTHNCPAGFLGSLASALFVHYALQGIDPKWWGHGLMTSALPKAHDYIKRQRRDVEDNGKFWDAFVQPWETFLQIRGIADGVSEPKFPENFNDVNERETFYKQFSLSGWVGDSGHDAPLIAYDSLLAAGNSWDELCYRAMLHGGDSDSTGTIAAACFGVMYGFQGVPKCHYENLEYRDRLTRMGEELLKISQQLHQATRQ